MSTSEKIMIRAKKSAITLNQVDAKITQLLKRIKLLEKKIML